MKTTIKRHGFSLHGFHLERVVCPDCKRGAEKHDILELDYINNKYRITFICGECQCIFEVESEHLKNID